MPLTNIVLTILAAAALQMGASASGLPSTLRQDIEAAEAPAPNAESQPTPNGQAPDMTATPNPPAEQPPPPEPPRPAPPPGPDVFGMFAVPSLIGLQDERWLRIGMLPSRNPMLAAMVRGASDLSSYQQASFVQAIVNSRFVYRSDQDNWGVKDYWASADETIARGAGDCEDLAVVKMQALRLLGFNERDLYLMIGTKPSGEEHALLLVRIDGRFWVMEDGLSRIVPAESFHMFIPAVTFGAGWKWVHSATRDVASEPAAAPHSTP